jgi:hypothetical protein
LKNTKEQRARELWLSVLTAESKAVVPELLVWFTTPIKQTTGKYKVAMFVDSCMSMGNNSRFIFGSLKLW